MHYTNVNSQQSPWQQSMQQDPNFSLGVGPMIIFTVKPGCIIPTLILFPDRSFIFFGFQIWAIYFTCMHCSSYCFPTIVQNRFQCKICPHHFEYFKTFQAHIEQQSTRCQRSAIRSQTEFTVANDAVTVALPRMGCNTLGLRKDNLETIEESTVQIKHCIQNRNTLESAGGNDFHAACSKVWRQITRSLAMFVSIISEHGQGN